MAQLDCRHFSGYKPCGLNDVCNESCPSYAKVGQRILIVHLEAMGAVIRSTALLPAIRRKYPQAHITWVTRSYCKPLLANNPMIDTVLASDFSGLMTLEAMEFDVGLCVDKALEAVGIINRAKCAEVFGFTSDPKTASIIPANSEAEELWNIGLSDHVKFYINKKSEIQLATEALKLPYKRDPYSMFLTDTEKAEANVRREQWLDGKDFIIGINTGCANVIPYKKLSVDGHKKLIKKLLEKTNARVVLLGGPEDTERNIEIGDGLDVLPTPTDKGLRDGLVSMEACDVIISGDSLGMHMGISLNKWIIAWFGPTCAHEIDLFDRGERIITSASCSPCWKRSCSKDPMCYDLVDFDKIVDSCKRGFEWHNSSSKQPSLATPSSASHS